MMRVCAEKGLCVSESTYFRSLQKISASNLSNSESRKRSCTENFFIKIDAVNLFEIDPGTITYEVSI